MAEMFRQAVGAMLAGGLAEEQYQQRYKELTECPPPNDEDLTDGEID